MNNDVRSSKEARAKRLMSLRRMTRLSKRAFASKYSIPIGNFQNWEGPRYGGLTEQGARRLIIALQKEGILCNLEWLMHGVGEGPKVTENLYLDKKKKLEINKANLAIDDDEIITRELLLFRQHYGETLELVVPDNGMEPYYRTGEYLAGKKFSIEYIENFIGNNYLIETNNGEILLRNLRYGSSNGFYNLVCTNFNTDNDRIIIYDAEILSVAPVMWIRRPLKICAVNKLPK